MSDVNQALGSIKEQLTAQTAVIAEVAEDQQELVAKVAELAAQIPENALVQEIATLVGAQATALRTIADVVPEPAPEPPAEPEA